MAQKGHRVSTHPREGTTHRGPPPYLATLFGANALGEFLKFGRLRRCMCLMFSSVAGATCGKNGPSTSISSRKGLTRTASVRDSNRVLTRRKDEQML